MLIVDDWLHAIICFYKLSYILMLLINVQAAYLHDFLKYTATN